MTTQKQSRKLLAKQKQAKEHLQKTMLNRSAEEMHKTIESDIEEESRELMAEHRQNEEQTQERMLRRSSAEVGVSSKDVDQ